MVAPPLESDEMSFPLSEAICKYWVPWRGLDWPLDWEGIFGRPADLVVEIGFGNGQFLVDLAKANPDRNFVGIERAWASVVRLFKRLEALDVNNVRVLEADAAFAMRHLFGPRSLHGVFINFPDPWHKERHHSRRLVQGPFVHTLAEQLNGNGSVTIATDQVEYAAWIAEVLEEQSELRSKHETTWLDFLPGRRPTKYEAKALQSGVPIHYFEWQQNSDLNLETRVDKVGEMPNVILEGEVDCRQVLAGAERSVWQAVEKDIPIVAKMMDVYGHLQEDHRLVSMMVREGELVQNFGISVVFRENGVLVKLASIGQPRATWGVKFAVKKIAELVCEGSDDLKVKSSTIDI
jgi:tRNA (guanine-N7-)-methyltransferase